MGEALGKVLIVVVDALTPRAIRMILLGLVAANGYGWWIHDSSLKAQQQTIQAYQVEMAGLRADMKAMAKSTDEGNQELRAIRQWLMSRR